MRRIAIFGAPLLFGLALIATAAAQQNEFAPGPRNDPDSCRNLWEGIGLPDYAREAERDSIIVCHDRYVLSYNNETRTPDWVIERLTRSQIVPRHKRPTLKFRPDPDVDPKRSAADSDYTGSKFDRGHQAPSADFAANPDWMVESFFLSNVVPQVGVGFNRHIWKDLEDHVRRLVTDGTGRPEIYVITGPVYRDEDGKTVTINANVNLCRRKIVIAPPKREAICGRKATCDNGVAVPAALFKIIYDPGMKRANAFILANINHRDAADFTDPVEYLKKNQTTVQVVEKYTDLEFFRGLTKRARRPVVDQCATMMLH